MISEIKGQSQRQNELRTEWETLYDALISNVNTLKKVSNNTDRSLLTDQIIRIVFHLSDIKDEDIYIDNLNEGCGPK